MVMEGVMVDSIAYVVRSPAVAIIRTWISA